MVEKIIKDEIATSQKDIDLFSGWLGRLENPDPTLRSQAAGKGLKLYDEVALDPHAASCLQTRILAVTGLEWVVEPADDSAQALEQAEFVKTVCLACNFDQARQELLLGILYGFFPAEVLWTVKNGQVVPARLLAKHPRRFVFDLDRRPRLLTMADMVTGEELPERKFVIFTFGSSDNPYGAGLGQKLWWPVWFKKNGIKFWLIFMEKFGMPTAVGKYPSGTSKEDQDALLLAVESIQSETGVKIPDTMIIELLEATRSGRVSYGELCEYMDRQISKCVLGQTASTEGTPGRLGNEQEQGDVRADIIKADADLLCECLNNSLVRWLVDYNFGPQPEYPKMWIRVEEEEEDLKALAERDAILVRELGLPVAKQYFYDTYGIPAPGKGEEVISPSLAAPGADGQFTEGAAWRFAATKPVVAPSDFVADRLAIEAQPAVDAWVERIQVMLETANSLEQFRELLLAAYDELPTGNLAGVLTEAMTAMQAAGRFDVREQSGD